MNGRSHFSQAYLIAAIAFVAAGVLGWQLAGKSTASTDSVVRPDKTRVAHRPNTGTPIWLADKLGQIRENHSFAQRLRLTIALANSVPDSEIFVWLRGRWFSLGDGFETQLFTRILTDRLDPMARARLHLLGKNAWQETDELLSLAASDPEGVIALFRENPNDIAELKILAEMAKHHPALALGRFLELTAFGFPEGESHDPRSVIHALVKSDPTALEAALGKLAYLQDDAERALLAQRLETSFDDEIEKLYARSDGWRLFKMHLGSTDILAKLFRDPTSLPSSWRNEIAKGKDWNGAADPLIAEFWWNADLKAAGFNEDQIKGIRKKALSGIAYHSPEKALPMIETAALNPQERKDFIQNIFSRAALSESETTMLLEMLKSDEDWQSAIDQLARKNGYIHVPPPQVDKPDQWLADFADLEPRSNANRNYRNMLSEWKDDQLAELHRQFQTLPDGQRIKVAENLVADASVRKEKIYGDAIRYLAAMSGQRPEIIGTATNYALKWSRYDPPAAAEWVNGLPAGETRDWVQKNLAAQWASVDPPAAESWLSSLPKAEQSKVRDFLKEKPAK